MTAVWLAGNGRLTKLKENVAMCSCMNKGRTALQCSSQGLREARFPKAGNRIITILKLCDCLKVKQCILHGCSQHSDC